MKRWSILIAGSCIFGAIYFVALVLFVLQGSLGTSGQLMLLVAVPSVALIAHSFGTWSVVSSRGFLRRVIDAVPSMIFVKDRDGRFRLVNQALANIYGTTVSEIIGKRDSDFNGSCKEVEHFMGDDLEVITNGSEKFIPEEEVTDCKGVTRWYQTVKRRVSFGPEAGVHVLGVSTDITETKRLQTELLQAQKMEAIGQLAGGIAHDFNNLLTAILGHAELLKIYGLENGEVARSAELIQAAANQAAALTAKLLAFARKGKHENVHVEVHSVIEEVKLILERTMSGRTAVVANLDAADSGVKGDAVQLQQVIMNLAINARDAIVARWGNAAAREGEIFIVTRNLTRAECGDFKDLPADGERFIEIRVGDNGCGIPAENTSKIFEPFFTTKEPGKGTGMGLPMVFGIVKAHGGGLTFVSKEGEGTQIHLLLPLSNEVTPVEKLPTAQVVNGTGRILLVDDNSDALESTSSMLSALGYQVIRAKDGIDAMRRFEGNEDEIDLAMVDLLMPKMGGEECLKVLRRCKPGLRVIVASGSGVDSLGSLQEDENVLFIQKPYRLDQLSRTVSQAMQGIVQY